MSNLDLDLVYERALGKVINYLSFGLRTEKEISQRLKTYLNKSYIPENERENLKSRVLTRLAELNMLDDSKVVFNVLSSIQGSTKPKSRNYIKNSMYKRGFTSSDISIVLDNIDPEQEFLSAQKDFEKKSRSVKDPMKLKRYLMGKGYSYEIIQRLFDQS